MARGTRKHRHARCCTDYRGEAEHCEEEKMRTLCMALLVVPMLAGCGHGAACLEREPFGEPLVSAVPVRAASPLLFDRHPGPWHASDFNYRSDWPSTPAFYSPGETILYSQRFVDYQGPRYGGNNDWTYRRAETVRFGMGFR
jgi:hypothetical protein